MEKKKVPIKKIILAIVLVIVLVLAVLLVLTIRKVSILNNILDKALETEKNTNCHVRIEAVGNVDAHAEAYAKGENVKFVKNSKEMISYSGQYNNVTYMATDFLLAGKKIYSEINGKYIVIRTIEDYFFPETLWKDAVESKICSTECNGKDCYEIKIAEQFVIWVEKETGLVVRELNVNTTKNYSYEFGTVTDADVQMPDFTGYENYVKAD